MASYKQTHVTDMNLSLYIHFLRIFTQSMLCISYIKKCWIEIQHVQKQCIKNIYVFSFSNKKNRPHHTIFTCNTSPYQKAWQHLAVTAACCFVCVGARSSASLVWAKTEPWRIRNENDSEENVRFWPFLYHFTGESANTRKEDEGTDKKDRGGLLRKGVEIINSSNDGD